MSRPLRVAMVGIVLINLGFVQITEAAEWSWLAALFVLTVAAPWLVSLTRYFWYRSIWNVGVQVVFGIMVHRFTGVGGAQHLLNDGLILAVLCQVHLLNSLNAKQKPDLLFFNSFLIAVVTSYLSIDLPYMVLFLLYVPVLVFGLQMLALTRTGAEPTGRLVRAILRQSVVRSAVVLVLTMGVFLFFPRDFQRKGFAGDAIKFKPPRGLMQTDFTEEVALDRGGAVNRSSETVMEVEVVGGPSNAVTGYWRGATHTRYRDGRWLPAPSPREGMRATWRGSRGRFLRRDGNGIASLRVVQRKSRAKRLFPPLNANRLRMTPPANKALIRADNDGTMMCEWGALPGKSIEYVMAVEAPFRQPGGKRRTRRRDSWMIVDTRQMPDRMRAVARDLARRAGSGAMQFQIVETMRSYLAHGYNYLAPGEDGGARDLAEFFVERKGAHCEIFATALVLMLRSEGIPSRLVTGYRSGEWDATQRVMTVRKRDSHAWVEVLDPQAGWMTVDPTPSLDAAAAKSASLWSEFRGWAETVWASVTNFNDATRLRVLAWLRDLPARALRYAWIAGLFLVWFVWRRRRRRARVPLAVADYGSVLATLKLERRAGETPRELLARADLEPDARSELEAATRRHEEVRYAVQ